VTDEHRDANPSMLSCDWTIVTGEHSDVNPSMLSYDWTIVTGEHMDVNPGKLSREWTTVTGEHMDVNPGKLSREWTLIGVGTNHCVLKHGAKYCNGYVTSVFWCLCQLKHTASHSAIKLFYLCKVNEDHT
jgi:hypothetical protein